MDSCPVPLGKAKSCEEAVRLKRIEYTLQFCSLTILYFDYLLTLPDEIKYIWLRKWRLSTLFYFFCRYALVANLLYLLSISEDYTGVETALRISKAYSYPCSCDTGYMICGILSIFGHIGILAVWSLRTCAVYNNNKFLMALFGSMTASSVILLCVGATDALWNKSLRISFFIDSSTSYEMHRDERYVKECVWGCDLRLAGPYSLLVLGANGAIVLALEILAFLLATFRVWKTRREIKQKTESTKVASLNEIIFSQGILYIGGVTVLSVGVLILNFKAKTGFVSRLLNGLKLPLSGFLTARFMLRLRAWSAIGSPNPHSATTTGTTTVPPMQFGEQHTFMGEFKGELGARSTRLSSDFDDTTTCGRDEQRGEQMTELRHHHHVGSSRDSFGGLSSSRSLTQTRKRASGSAVDLEEGAYSPRPVFDTKGKGVQSADEGNDHDEGEPAKLVRL
ncbi:hypothetical protein CC1G_08432 [Coprinopsis cinerea okayama7|uniref:DUF6533 domain-containing protein n=1 Tax=Coprinopsis cinerea (strain Okayama-7 / 130 / ATCC MYA-4618 / FGSC 9003) TaxID=240176 RepID=A8NAR3_COPC7|nr:hypothetical protein CC1G_08432 [Coprinopsis cinerea okayama7\|eukprot:XP_001831915.2 hypothetical protein CC1G_08432 [Coprinopsis cinerea okayama7\